MRDLSTLCFKITAILIIVFGLRFLPVVIDQWFGSVMGGSRTEFHLYLAMFVVSLSVGSLLWFSSKFLSSRLFADTESPFSAISANDLQVVAFSVVGMVVLVSSISDIVWTVIRFLEKGATMPSPTIAGAVTSMALTIGAGLWLLLGSRGIVSAINRLRGREVANTSFERDA